MIIHLTQESNLSNEMSNVINDLSNKIAEYFRDKNYGLGIDEIFIGIISVKPEFDNFFKPRKPRYLNKRNENLTLNVNSNPENTFSYDIKLDYFIYNNLSLEDLQTELAKEIIISLNNLDTLSKKIIDFDVIKFKSDFVIFLSKF